jgi:methylthioribulose-1-phosphate dehydratase
LNRSFDAVSDSRTRLLFAIHSVHRSGWAPGTGGNYSALLSGNPFRLLMSPSGFDKGRLQESDLIEVDEHGRKISGAGNPSAETLLHVAIIRQAEARSVLHTHSVWNTLLSEHYADQRELVVSGYEMLKGLSGVTTHEHREHVPILKNSQDIPALAERVADLLEKNKSFHGFLLENHGLYTWGATIEDALRHVEIFEFLFEVLGRKLSFNGRS